MISVVDYLTFTASAPIRISPSSELEAMPVLFSITLVALRRNPLSDPDFEDGIEAFVTEPSTSGFLGSGSVLVLRTCKAEVTGELLMLCCGKLIDAIGSLTIWP